LENNSIGAKKRENPSDQKQNLQQNSNKKEEEKELTPFEKVNNNEFGRTLARQITSLKYCQILMNHSHIVLINFPGTSKRYIDLHFLPLKHSSTHLA